MSENELRDDFTPKRAEGLMSDGRRAALRGARKSAAPAYLTEQERTVWNKGHNLGVRQRHDEEQLEMLRKDLEELVTFTEKCRPNMHEPDEQGIYAQVFGTHLDNAMGNHVSNELVEKGAQEYVVQLVHSSEGDPFERGHAPTATCHINLATLIALARKAELI